MNWLLPMEQANELLTFHASAVDGLQHCLHDGHELTPFGAWCLCGDCPVCGAHWYRDPHDGTWLSVGAPEDCVAHRAVDLLSLRHLVA